MDNLLEWQPDATTKQILKERLKARVEQLEYMIEDLYNQIEHLE